MVDRSREIRAVDIVWSPPGERTLARRGANDRDDAHRCCMLEGNVVEWIEHVSDEQYGR